MTSKEIDVEICRLHNLKNEQVLIEAKKFQTNAVKNVGRCFSDGTYYVVVIDVPQTKSTLTEVTFNQYQYPALYINSKNTKAPIYIDKIFSGIWGDGNDIINRNYKEISKEEFINQYNEVVNSYRNKILGLMK